MIFENILEKKCQDLDQEFDKLYNLIVKNQTFIGDLLLVYINGSYNPEVHKWDNLDTKLSPYMFGWGYEGHSETTHKEFIGHYMRNNITRKSLNKEDNSGDSEILDFNESLSIQHEMLVYLKIWESDLFIKRLYNLTNLLSGKGYDWHFTLNGADNKRFQSRSKIIKEKIIKEIKLFVPGLSDSFERAYFTQIRNAIAHSQYSILGRSIMFNNFRENSKTDLKAISFEKWTELFHETLALYIHYIQLLELINEQYGFVARQNNGQFFIKINRKDPIETTEFKAVYFRESFKDWGWEVE
ncbi:hypothetical protein D3C87_98840 [compost metagenome]